jgi:hypothetical protein
MEKNTVLFSNVDREDGWVSSGIAFKVKNTSTYEDAYNEIKDKLEAPEMIQHIIEDHCLQDDLFNGDETFVFTKTYWNRGLYFVFKNDAGEEVEHKKSADLIYLAE